MILPQTEQLLETGIQQHRLAILSGTEVEISMSMT